MVLPHHKLGIPYSKCILLPSVDSLSPTSLIFSQAQLYWRFQKSFRHQFSRFFFVLYVFTCIIPNFRQILKFNCLKSLQNLDKLQDGVEGRT